MIRLNVFITVCPDKKAEYITLAKELVAASQAESGCIAYDLFESSTRPEVMLICETWSDSAALEAHNQTEHFKKIAPQLGELGKMKIESFEF